MVQPLARRALGERSRELLLDAAAEEFWVHGLEGTRIQDVLDRAEMTKGGLYHHFDSKHELAKALADHEAEQWPIVLAHQTLADARGLHAMRELSTAVATRLESNVRARAVLRIADELALPEATSAFVLWHDFVIRALQQAIADGEVSDTIAIRDVATAVVESIAGVCLSIAPMSRAIPLEHRLSQLWSLLTPGLRANAPTSPQLHTR